MGRGLLVSTPSSTQALHRNINMSEDISPNLACYVSWTPKVFISQRRRSQSCISWHPPDICPG